MAKQTRFDSLLGAAKTADTRTEQGDGADQSPVEAKPTIEGAGEFWAQFEDDEPEATDRLNVEIRRSLHSRLKKECANRGVTKRDVIEALIEWALSD